MIGNCQFCGKEKNIFFCRLFGDVITSHKFRSCLSCIEKMKLVVVSQEDTNGRQEVETGGSGEGLPRL